MQVIKLANNQIILKETKKITFVSYETIICKITNFENGNEPIIKITKGQPESATTSKYLSQFILLMTGKKVKFKIIKKGKL